MDQATIAERLEEAALQRVKGAKQNEATDVKVVRTAERRLQGSPYSALRSITCEFHEGVLVLRGQVTSHYLKQQAQETIRTVEGVIVIINIVKVVRETNGTS